MRLAYLALAVAGAIVPYVFFFQFFEAEGVSLARFVKALFVNGAAGGFSADVLISSFAFWLFITVQFLRAKGPKPYVFIVLNLAIGLSCALPAYLYAREKS